MNLKMEHHNTFSIIFFLVSVTKCIGLKHHLNKIRRRLFLFIPASLASAATIFILKFKIN